MLHLLKREVTMPKQKGRGKVIRHVTLSLPGNKFVRCDVYSKAGPKGGHLVCGTAKTKKKP